MPRKNKLENLGLSCEISKEELQQILEELFPSLNFYHWKMEQGEICSNDSILFTLLRNRSEFPIKLDLYGFPSENVAEREQYIAQQLSIRLECRTIVPYQEKDSSYPYHSIIFDRDEVYLANDYDTLWADDEGGEVRIIGSIHLKERAFDSTGNIKHSS